MFHKVGILLYVMYVSLICTRESLTCCFHPGHDDKRSRSHLHKLLTAFILAATAFVSWLLLLLLFVVLYFILQSLRASLLPD